MKKICLGIWILDLFLKIKIFWWRILYDGLFVVENLRKWNIKVDIICQMCGEYFEIQFYLLFYCKVIKEVWGLVFIGFGQFDGVRDDIYQNVNEFILLVKKDKREFFNFFIGWRVWKKRNNLIF